MMLGTPFTAGEFFTYRIKLARVPAKYKIRELNL